MEKGTIRMWREPCWNQLGTGENFWNPNCTCNFCFPITNGAEEARRGFVGVSLGSFRAVRRLAGRREAGFVGGGANVDLGHKGRAGGFEGRHEGQFCTQNLTKSQWFYILCCLAR